MLASWVVLVVLLAYGAVAFGWRSWHQWRRTGSTGFRGLSGSPGSPEWFGGALLVVAFALAVVTPVVVLAEVISVARLPWEVRGLGAVGLGVGFGGTIAAQMSMGDSWRIGVDSKETTELVARGFFRICRNPIFTSMLIFLAGLALLLPTYVSVLAFVSALVGLEIQVRLVEEPYLLTTHGDAYARYAARVGRFVPYVGHLPARFDSSGNLT